MGGDDDEANDHADDDDDDEHNVPGPTRYQRRGRAGTGTPRQDNGGGIRVPSLKRKATDTLIRLGSLRPVVVPAAVAGATLIHDAEVAAGVAYDDVIRTDPTQEENPEPGPPNQRYCNSPEFDSTKFNSSDIGMEWGFKKPVGRDLNGWEMDVDLDKVTMLFEPEEAITFITGKNLSSPIIGDIFDWGPRPGSLPMSIQQAIRKAVERKFPAVRRGGGRVVQPQVRVQRSSIGIVYHAGKQLMSRIDLIVLKPGEGVDSLVPRFCKLRECLDLEALLARYNKLGAASEHAAHAAQLSATQWSAMQRRVEVNGTWLLGGVFFLEAAIY